MAETAMCQSAWLFLKMNGFDMHKRFGTKRFVSRTIDIFLD